MIRGFTPYRSKLSRSTEPNQAASHWWRPLTHWWGICGVIIFIGLVVSLIDTAARWGNQLASSITERPVAASDAPGSAP